MDAEFMPRKRRSKKRLRRGMSKRRKRARTMKRNAKGHFVARKGRRKKSRVRIQNRVTSKGRGISVKTLNGKVVAYRRFNLRTRRFSWKPVGKQTPQSRAIVLAKLHAFAGRK